MSHCRVVLYEHDEKFSKENPLYMQTGDINFINWTFNFSVTLDGIYDIILYKQQWLFQNRPERNAPHPGKFQHYDIQKKRKAQQFCHWN